MLDDYEFYQGVVLRQLAVENDYSMSVSFRPFVREGRINAFVMNGRVGVYIKHSSKRMSPWRFTFNIEQAADLLDLEHKFPDSFMVFVCGTDGLVTLTCADLHSIVSFQESENAWVSISRPPRTQYELAGNRGELKYKVSRGIGTIPETLKTRVRERYATG
ncbi:hypothetical protein ABIF63_010158 [Bradyrhizobium japonicum]|uniref:Uncharacterized protein n=1 Tax=Bradyrhizobium japonicum TaxID=375 RepID=A0ABV2SA43_BRAJP|nr:hypothetical protein [Bradyrhizobium japonicum]UQE00037.1 hypothetical protein JEY30_07110 [Bradyrhizobium japonicum]WLB20054.1 hypothetical protein QIH95_03500 [Bradyrhizobium japonicum]